MSYTEIKGIPARIFPDNQPKLFDRITIELDLSVLSIGIANYGSTDPDELTIGAIVKSATLITKRSA